MLLIFLWTEVWFNGSLDQAKAAWRKFIGWLEEDFVMQPLGRFFSELFLPQNAASRGEGVSSVVVIHRWWHSGDVAMLFWTNGRVAGVPDLAASVTQSAGQTNCTTKQPWGTTCSTDVPALGFWAIHAFPVLIKQDVPVPFYQRALALSQLLSYHELVPYYCRLPAYADHYRRRYFRGQMWPGVAI